jgi:CelD/BcsL family acetyltransferase involved in cellulose biosynthesis
VDFTVVDGDALDGSDRARWRTLLANRPGLPSPFLTPTFTQVVARHRVDTRVMVVRDGARTYGYLPYQRTAERVGLPVGAHLNDVQALVGGSSLGVDAREVVRAMGVRDFRFDHLLVDEPTFEPYVRVTHPSPVVELSQGTGWFEESLRARSRKLFEQDSRTRRRLTREVGAVTFEWSSTSHQLLERLFDWKSAQYRRTGVVDVLAPTWTRAVLHELLEVDQPECRGLLSVLRAGERVLALHFGLLGAAVLHYWFPVYESDLASASPGMLLLLDLVRAAPGHGIALVDLGMGDHSYKRRVATGSYELARGQVPARGDAYRVALLARHPDWLRRRLAVSGRRLAGRVTARHAG